MTKKMSITEWTFMGRVLVWIHELILNENLLFQGADQEMRSKIGGKRPDIVIWKNKKIQDAYLLISLKSPQYDAWNAADDALLKASKLGIRYFATWNVNKFFMWDKDKSGDLFDQLCYQKDVLNIKKLDEIDRYETQIKSFLTEFLIDFSEVITFKKALPLLPIDERFIYRIRSAIDAFSIPVFDLVKNKYNKSKKFSKEVREWFAEQLWTFSGSIGDFERISRQYIYLLINKILFYNILRSKFPEIFTEIQIAKDVKGDHFRDILQTFFNDVMAKKDYETVFAMDFIDTLPLPDEITDELIKFIERIGKYQFSKLGYEIIGRVFERFIPEEERRKLGQYYTRSDVVDLMIGFCVKDADAKILDGACGAGTFLVRSYMRKKLLNPKKTHNELLNELYGNDIAKFPVHLATMNLVFWNLDVKNNYPKILCRDFFSVEKEKETPLLSMKYAKKYSSIGLDEKKTTVIIPVCDAVIMNPPYTRQEEMESLIYPEGYRITLQEQVKKEWGFHVSKRSSIYSYFFFYGAKFVKEDGGRLGLITSNSWLDVDYGKYLEEFFLNYFKITAVIESKVERWFEDADVNTAITILEKCKNEKSRNKHRVKFVQLKRPLLHLIKTEDEATRWASINEFVNLVEECEKHLTLKKLDFLGKPLWIYDDENVRIVVKEQGDLYKECLL